MNLHARNALLFATVRVRDGAGVVVKNGKASVVVTAHHVVSADGPSRVRAGDKFWDQTVIGRDTQSDLAILNASPELESRAIEIASPDVSVGDQVWASGFPLGWDGADAVLARGTIAGFGQTENWVTMDGSWGLSGGPVCTVSDDRVQLAGVMLGRGGDTSGRMAGNRRSIEQFKQVLAALEAQMSALPASIGAPADMVKLSVMMMRVQLGMFEENAILLEQHFRTGFLRFASLPQVRAVLGLT